jgi:hypothetical protein
MPAPKNRMTETASSAHAASLASTPKAAERDTFLEEVIQRLQEQEQPVLLKLRGFQNQVKLDLPLSEIASAKAQEAILVYQRRRDLLAEAIRALQALQQHLNYPALPRFRLSQNDYDFFRQQPAAMISANEQYDVEDPPATYMEVDFIISAQP